MKDMIDPTLKARILEDLDRMTTKQQQEAERRVHAVLFPDEEPLLPPTHGRDVLHLAGIVDAESAREALKAVQEGCEQIDPRDW